MSDTPTERHNQLVVELISKSVKGTENFGELMVLVESYLAGIMLAMNRVHNLSKSDAADIAQDVLSNAIARLAKEGE